MKPEDAEAIGVFVAEMININQTGKSYEMLIDDLKRHFGGTPGSGTCICQHSPKMMKRQAELWHEPFEQLKGNMVLDHRCPFHGQEAQPKLWGRHKTLELSVSPAQWISLGVEYPEP